MIKSRGAQGYQTNKKKTKKTADHSVKQKESEQKISN